MLDNWFLSDVKNKLENNSHLVIIDEQNKCDFLFELLDTQKYKLYRSDCELDELKVKYQIEKDSSGQKNIIITHTLIDKLTFLREYAETNGHLIIKFVHRYISDKIDEHLPFDIKLEEDELVTAGKLSFGKDKVYWKSVSVKGISGIFENFEEEVLRFIANPKSFINMLDSKLSNTFYKLLFGYLDRPIIEKPPETIANEVIIAIFDNLLYDHKNKFFTCLFDKWRNSKKDYELLVKKLNSFSIPKNIDMWQVPQNHPFRKIDDLWLADLAKNINDQEWVNSKSILFRERSRSHIAQELGIVFWIYIETLISYDKKAISKISSLEEAAIYFTDKFSKVDRAIRKLYTEFINQQDIIRPLQEYYERILNEYLEKWFNYFETYKQNQQGLLKRIFDDNKNPIAVIVGDGINYEIGKTVSEKLGEEFNSVTGFVYSDYPSETENNMSRIYIDEDIIVPIQADRQKRLLDETKKDIHFLNIDEISYSDLFDYLIVVAKDVDSLSEKMQQKALKYFDQIEAQLADTIKMLLSIGYKKVLLISDHGFVLTGVLAESDKIEVNNLEKGAFKSERFMGVKDELKDSYGSLYQKKKDWKEYKYLVFSKTIKPFKTTGAYGYSHGGITPQELITPFFTFTKLSVSTAKLKVEITQKEQLKEIIGGTFALELSAKAEIGDLFNAQRKVVLVFLKDKKSFYESDIITIQTNEVMKKEFTTPTSEKFEILLLDAETKENLDKVSVVCKSVRKINL
jgi:hypothetical protein